MKKNYSTLTARVLASISLLLLSFTLSFGQSMDINQTVSDGAQSHQIAFDGLGFLSGDFCSSTFLPPGKVADYFGFQYMRDNDITFMGHNSDCLLISYCKTDLSPSGQVHECHPVWFVREPIYNRGLEVRDVPPLSLRQSRHFAFRLRFQARR